MSNLANNLSQYVFLFAHGAGADMNSEWMLNFDKLLTEMGLEVIRFNFPYMMKRLQDGIRRPPDRAPRLLETFKQQIDLLPKDKKLIIGGKSMGGRMASLLVAYENLNKEISGVICLGYPFHPPKKLDKYKGAHLAEIQMPTLILQGERDTMGTRQEIDSYVFSDPVQIKFLGDGDHSFKPRVKSGLTLEFNMRQASEALAGFINALT